MTNQEMLISYINKLTEDEISSLLEAASLMLETKEPAEKPPCPYCGCGKVIRYGHACQKQRFLCKICGRTFVPTTNTVMANSHFPASVWKEMVKDTLHGNAIDFSAKRLVSFTRRLSTCAIKYFWRCRSFLKSLMPAWGKCLSSTRPLSWTAIKAGSSTVPLQGLPVNMVQKPKKEAFPMNISASVRAFSAKGMPLPPPSTGQNPAPGNSSVYLTGISRTERSPFVTG